MEGMPTTRTGTETLAGSMLATVAPEVAGLSDSLRPRSQEPEHWMRAEGQRSMGTGAVTIVSGVCLIAREAAESGLRDFLTASAVRPLGRRHADSLALFYCRRISSPSWRLPVSQASRFLPIQAARSPPRISLFRASRRTQSLLLSIAQTSRSARR